MPQEVAIVFDQPWEGNMSGGMSVLRADDGLYRLCYKAGPDQHSFGCYAESRDGITWTRPSLGLFEVAGTRGDNCAGDFSPFEDTRPGVPLEHRYVQLEELPGNAGVTGPHRLSIVLRRTSACCRA